MKTLILAAIRCSLIFTAVVALSIVYPTSVQAVPTTYQYTGNPFTFAIGDYTRRDFVTVTLTLAGPLAPNMPFTPITPIAFTFSDGVQTITNLTPPPVAGFLVATGGAGQIRSWDMAVLFAAHGLPPYIITIFDTADPDNSFDVGSATIDSIGGNNGAPGTWTTVGNVSDTGSTLAMMTLTLMALGVAARRFQRAAA